MKNKICVLRTEYSIEIHKISNDEHMKKNKIIGYRWYDEKLIVIPDISEKEYSKSSLRYSENSF